MFSLKKNIYKDRSITISSLPASKYSIWTSKPHCFRCLKPLKILSVKNNKAQYFLMCECILNFHIEIEKKFKVQLV